MTVRVLHVLDHSIPLHSGYTFRTLSLLREQRRLGWETFHLTSPKHTAPSGAEETVDGWHFYRTLVPKGGRELPLIGQWRQMKQTEARLLEVARAVKPNMLHAHSPVLNAVPALRVAGSVTFSVLRRGAILTPKSAADLTANGLDFAFMMFGSDA